jgi:hypothetical protein
MASFWADFDREAGNKNEGIGVGPEKRCFDSDFDPSRPRHQTMWCSASSRASCSAATGVLQKQGGRPQV